jgi:hypothetical protein
VVAAGLIGNTGWNVLLKDGIFVRPNRVKRRIMKSETTKGLLGGLLVLLLTFSLAWDAAPEVSKVSLGAASEPESARSAPPDTTPYTRPTVFDDYFPAGRRAITPEVFIVDLVVNNTDPNLTNTDTFNDGETSIAVNQANPDEIVVTAFSGSWSPGAANPNAPLWHSTDGGFTWTKQRIIPPPPGVPPSETDPCPCDQTIDYGRNNELSGTFLVGNSAVGFNVYSGTSTDPANAEAWNWFAPDDITQMTNHNVPSTLFNSDQPWLLVNIDPADPAHDNLYVAYDDFSVSPRDMRVAVAQGTNPPNFTIDNSAGSGPTGTINPGHRLAVDPLTGFVYSLFQQLVAPGPGGSRNINYMLNRSTDGGTTWTLNGSPTGILVANADSTQPTPKFGTVNALLGGVIHAAVDANTGDIYYVYGNRDPETENNRLAIRRIQSDGEGGVIVGPVSFVTDQVEAAIPSVALTIDGTMGVFHYTFDGFSEDDFPIFTAHLALSNDSGETFTALPLLTFLSSARDSCPAPNCLRQRVLGDYMQMKALGNCFYGAFTGNGVPFGRPFANHDPIFFKVCMPVKGVSLSVSPSVIPPGGEVTATWSGITAPTSTDWIGLYLQGTDDFQLIDWIYVSCSQIPGDPQANGSCPFVLPAALPEGSYEMRLFADNSFTRLATSNAFTVDNSASAAR